MSDTAAFFAQKKKKKAFKFNANLVDASSVTSSIHVDAPALSTDHDPLSVANSATFSAEIKDALDQSTINNENSEQWDDESMVANTFKKNLLVTNATSTGTAGVLDMKSLDPKRSDPDNIAEKLRLQETKAQLAAAREGMEREAAKLKEERERKEKAKMDAEKSRFGVAASSGIWVAPHLRSSGAATMSRSRVGIGSTSQKLDVQDEELFPDLASAGKILERMERNQAPLFKAPKKTPVGGNASWASKAAGSKGAQPVASAASKIPDAPPTKKDNVVQPKIQEEIVEPVMSKPSIEEAEKIDTPPEVSSPASETASQVAVKKTVTKKKKKDLSTFKPGSS